MKLKSKNIYKTALEVAVEKGNNEIIELLIKKPNIDPNITII